MILQYFIYDASVESEKEFETRMAGVVDSIRNDVECEGINYHRMLSEEEQNEIVHYVMEFITPEIVKTAEGIAAENHLGKMTTEFVNEFVAVVMKEFPKFNNLKSRKTDENCEELRKLSTFASNYRSEAMRNVFEKQQMYGTRDNRKIRSIDRTIEYILAETDYSGSDITPELIEEYMPKVSSAPIDADEINKMLAVKQSVFSIDVRDNAEELMDKRNCFDIVDPAIEKFLKDWIDGMRNYRKLIFLQNWQFCPDEYKDMTVKEFSCTDCLLKACRADNIGAKNIKSGNLKVVRTNNRADKNNIEDIALDDVEHVEETHITKSRWRSVESLKNYIEEHKIPADELENQMERFFSKYCDELLAEIASM